MAAEPRTTTSTFTHLPSSDDVFDNMEFNVLSLAGDNFFNTFCHMTSQGIRVGEYVLFFSGSFLFFVFCCF